MIDEREQGGCASYNAHGKGAAHGKVVAHDKVVVEKRVVKKGNLKNFLPHSSPLYWMDH